MARHHSPTQQGLNGNGSADIFPTGPRAITHPASKFSQICQIWVFKPGVNQWVCVWNFSPADHPVWLQIFHGKPITLRIKFGSSHHNVLVDITDVSIVSNRLHDTKDESELQLRAWPSVDDGRGGGNPRSSGGGGGSAGGGGGEGGWGVAGWSNTNDGILGHNTQVIVRKLRHYIDKSVSSTGVADLLIVGSGKILKQHVDRIMPGSEGNRVKIEHPGRGDLDVPIPLPRPHGDHNPAGNRAYGSENHSQPKKILEPPERMPTVNKVEGVKVKEPVIRETPLPKTQHLEIIKEQIHIPTVAASSILETLENALTNIPCNETVEQPRQQPDSKPQTVITSTKEPEGDNSQYSVSNTSAMEREVEPVKFHHFHGKCSVCQQTFTNGKSFDGHLRNTGHTHTCTICSSTLRRASTAYGHYLCTLHSDVEQPMRGTTHPEAEKPEAGRAIGKDSCVGQVAKVEISSNHGAELKKAAKQFVQGIKANNGKPAEERKPTGPEQSKAELAAIEKTIIEQALREQAAKTWDAMLNSARERIAREKAEKDATDAKALAEMEKASKEKKEREAMEEAARKEAAMERAAKEKAQRDAKEVAAREKVAREKAERDKEKAEIDAKEKAERAASLNAAIQRAQREWAERDANEKAAREKAARDKAAKEKAEKNKAAKEKAAKEKAAKEKAERDKAAKEKAERDKAARERKAKEKARAKEAREKNARQQAEARRETESRERAAREQQAFIKKAIDAQAERDRAAKEFANSEKRRAAKEKAQRERAKDEQVARENAKKKKTAKVDIVVKPTGAEKVSKTVVDSASPSSSPSPPPAVSKKRKRRGSRGWGANHKQMRELSPSPTHNSAGNNNRHVNPPTTPTTDATSSAQANNQPQASYQENQLRLQELALQRQQIMLEEEKLRIAMLRRNMEMRESNPDFLAGPSTPLGGVAGQASTLDIGSNRRTKALIICSACGCVGHNRKNTLCPARQAGS
ncbi:hypothetical protein DFH27DRAFT_522328 [Peziza echinospora]|nr:hypothetical protein DFH27DRAFT_522328 [Peziza echinospora]